MLRHAIHQHGVGCLRLCAPVPELGVGIGDRRAGVREVGAAVGEQSERKQVGVGAWDFRHAAVVVHHQIKGVLGPVAAHGQPARVR